MGRANEGEREIEKWKEQGREGERDIERARDRGRERERDREIDKQLNWPSVD